MKSFHERVSRFGLETAVCLSLCEIVNSPRALAVKLMLEAGDFTSYLALEIDPNNYECPDLFADDYLVTKTLSKSQQQSTGTDLRQKAVDSFRASEQSCSVSNRRIHDASHKVPALLLKAKSECHKILGELSSKDLRICEDNFRFGPGANNGIAVKRGHGLIASQKYDDDIHLTSKIIPFYKAILGERWWKHQARPKVVEGNYFTSVPKSAKTDRGICVEPTLNSYVQLGIGALIRDKLKRIGIDLSTQDTNQRLAREAYTKKLSTIDLAAASDSMSVACVEFMVDTDWYKLLDLPRSPFTLIEGEQIELEKFSSMGNGYTFELETLIFVSVCRACVLPEDYHDMTVYGDDIIVPEYAASSVIEVLNFLGFKVNTEKSFLAGNFFESCGTDWFKGQSVRPFFLRAKGDSDIPYAVQIANSLRIYASQRMSFEDCDPRFFDLWRSVLKHVPSAWRKCKVPHSFGDSGIISSYDEIPYISPDYGGASKGIEGQLVKHIVLVPKKRITRSVGFLFLMLAITRKESHDREIRDPHLWRNRKNYLIDDSPPRNGFEPIRGHLGKPKTKLSLHVRAETIGLSWSNLRA